MVRTPMGQPVRTASFLAFSALVSCAAIPPRFEQQIATTFAQDDMRHLLTEDVDLYYPAHHREAAERIAARAGECLRRLRSMALTPNERTPALLYLTPANFNNAYVFGQSAGEPMHSVNPLFVTDEIFHWFGFGATEPGDISCHEMFHYAHYEQVENLWWAVNRVFGPVFPPQAFLERWFTEGAAQFYEGRIRRHVGRPASPLYKAAFDSFVAQRGGRISAGDLSLYQRELSPFSGAYLTGLYFIDWLATRYSEEKLWEVMDMQGRSVFSPLGVTLRVKAVYGKSVGALLDEWSDELTTTLPHRVRPADQKVLRTNLGQLVRLGADSATGTMALISSGNEEVPKLRILERDGTVRVERRLIRIGTDREWVLAGPTSMSGLSFSTDGKWLYIFNDDLRDRGDTRGQLWQVDAATGDVVKVHQNVGTGMGGALRPDGTRYTFIELSPDHSVITDFDLSTGEKKALLELPNHVTLASLGWSPDGKRLVFSRFEEGRWQLSVLETETGRVLGLAGSGTFSYGAKFSDNSHVVYVDELEGRLQVHRRDLDTHELERVTDVPFGVVDPVPVGDSVAFINRDGSQWSLDAAALTGTSRQMLTLGAVAEDRVLTRAPSSELDETPGVKVEHDEAYSSLDHLFVPQLRVPNLVVISGPSSGASFILGAQVTGRDRLAKHSWLFSGLVQPIAFPETPGDRFFQLNAEYRNMTLAPWDFDFNAFFTHVPSSSFGGGEVSLRRTVFTTDAGFGFRALVDQPLVNPRSTRPAEPLRRYIGPSFSVAYAAGDSTPYAGLQRYFAFEFGIAAYPKGLGSSFNMLDVGAGMTLAAPLPLSTRHSFVMNVRGRVLPGAPDGALQVGGIPRGSAFYAGNSGTVSGTSAHGYVPGALYESVRGYEDSRVFATAAAVSGARYRYNFIIDRGFASAFYIFPSVFFRQVNVEAFGTLAFTNNAATPVMRAAGGLVELKTVFMGALPVSGYYQFAYRFDGAGGPIHVFGLSLD